MTPLIPHRPELNAGGSALHGWVDPRLDRSTYRARWAAQAALWRVLELARMTFGSGAEVRLEGSPGRPGLQGLLHLEVPFRDLDDHRAREGVFLSAVRADELLQAVPLLFIFGIGRLSGSSDAELPALPEELFSPLSGYGGES